jgi:hypothetical protein
MFADEPPKADVFMGHSFPRFNSAQTSPGISATTSGWKPLEAHNGNVNNYQVRYHRIQLPVFGAQ